MGVSKYFTNYPLHTLLIKPESSFWYFKNVTGLWNISTIFYNIIEYKTLVYN